MDSGRKRRALSQARAPAPIKPWGEPEAAERLVRALDVAGTPPEAARGLTHGFHTYPAKMHPLTARRALQAAGAKPKSVVLDPFCGSGTVLVEAYRAGARAIGVDASPLAVLVAGAKVPGSGRDVRALVRSARRIAALVVAEGKAARRSGYEAPPERPLPPGVSAAERTARLRGWFEPHVRREVEALAAAGEAEPEEALRPLLLAILSSILVKVSRRESDTSATKVERRIGRGMAARLFAQRAEELAAGLDALDREAPRGTTWPTVTLGDARKLPEADASVQAIVTSPPYAGTYDYLEQHALRLAFLGLGPAPFEAREVGARRSFAGKSFGQALGAWERDLGAAFDEMARVLVPKGRAIVLIGDSLAGERAVWADDLVAKLAPRSRLTLSAAASQARRELGTAERAAFGERGKWEHLCLLEKP